MNRTGWILGIALAWTLMGTAPLPAQPMVADQQTLPDLRAKALKNEAKAMNELGEVFALGKLGVTKDYTEAYKWWTLAGDKGHTGARGSATDLAVLMTPQQIADGDKRVKEYKLQQAMIVATAPPVPLTSSASITPPPAVERKAQPNEPDTEIVAGLRTKAGQGDAQSMYEIGRAFLDGTYGKNKDAAEAAAWFQRAADQGHARAQCALGRCYAEGQGVEASYSEATRWYRKAADQSFPKAQFNLGACYAKGQGVGKDRVEAYKWILLASMNGDPMAKEALPQLQQGLSPQQLMDGQRRVQAYKPRVQPERRSLF